jgi:hypothetical protein
LSHSFQQPYEGWIEPGVILGQKLSN